MPELPDVVVYLEHIEAKALGHALEALRPTSPFLLRTVDPPPAAFAGRVLSATRRIGKRLVLEFDAPGSLTKAGKRRKSAAVPPLFAVLHLMVAGRLHWRKPGAKPNRMRTQAHFVFPHGVLELTEAGSKRRASLHLIGDPDDLAPFHAGGLPVTGPSAVDEPTFRERLTAANHTLKRALTDPHLFDGIGGAYADEILHAARLSPIAMTQKLTPAEVARLHLATRDTLAFWIDRVRAHYADSPFPEKVTAFRPDMAVHGKFNDPCPTCGTPIQRIVYASRDTNYCPTCQTDGRVLADRALSRLLKSDWPRTVDELENASLRKPPARPQPSRKAARP